WNHVPRKRVSCFGIDKLLRERRKIAISRALRRHGCRKVSGDQVALAEVISKEEQLVLDDRPPDGSPEFVDVCDGLRQKGSGFRFCERAAAVPNRPFAA